MTSFKPVNRLLTDTQAVLDSLEAYTLALFTRVLGWDANTVHIFLANVRAEIKDPKHHLFLFVYCVYGRKPT